MGKQGGTDGRREGEGEGASARGRRMEEGREGERGSARGRRREGGRKREGVNAVQVQRRRTFRFSFAAAGFTVHSPRQASLFVRRGRLRSSFRVAAAGFTPGTRRSTRSGRQSGAAAGEASEATVNEPRKQFYSYRVPYLSSRTRRRSGAAAGEASEAREGIYLPINLTVYLSINLPIELLRAKQARGGGGETLYPTRQTICLPKYLPIYLPICRAAACEAGAKRGGGGAKP